MTENCKFCEAVKKWIAKPFDDDGNVFDWFLFIGLVGIISWLWSRILERILR